MKKTITRRKIIKSAIQAGVALPILGYQFSSCQSQDNQEKSLKILILGGTSFLGPHQIAYALSRGHEISTFTRGKTKPTIHQKVFDNVEMLIGDRENNLTALEGRKWDVVIDNSGRDVRWAKSSAELLKGNVSQYIYTSSTGVYYPYLTDNIIEDTKLMTEEPAGIEDEEIKMEYGYGVMKTNSENAVRAVFGEKNSLMVRPTYMMGPGDKTDRFTYWPIRVAKGGDIMVPGKKEDPVQYIDVRDVAEWMIRLAENKESGAFNAVGPKEVQTVRQFAGEALQAFDVEGKLVYIDDYKFLQENGVSYLVPWIPPIGNNYGSSMASNNKALNAGLTIRSLKESLVDTHAWWHSDALTQERRDKMEKKENGLFLREQAILEKWEAKDS